MTRQQHFYKSDYIKYSYGEAFQFHSQILQKSSRCELFGHLRFGF